MEKKFTCMPNEIGRDASLDPFAFRVLFIIKSYDWQPNKCTRSFAQIADEAGCSKRRVITAIGTLIDRGLISSSQNGAGRRATYWSTTATASAPQAPEETKSIAPDAMVTETTDAPDAQVDPKPLHVVHPTVARGATRIEEDNKTLKTVEKNGASAPAPTAQKQQEDGSGAIARIQARLGEVRTMLGDAQELDAWVSHLCASRKGGKVAPSVILADFTALAALADQGLDWREAIRKAITKDKVPIGYVTAIAKRLAPVGTDEPGRREPLPFARRPSAEDSKPPAGWHRPTPVLSAEEKQRQRLEVIRCWPEWLQAELGIDDNGHDLPGLVMTAKLSHARQVAGLA